MPEKRENRKRGAGCHAAARVVVVTTALAAALAACGRGKTDAGAPGEIQWTDAAPAIAARFPRDAHAATDGPIADPAILCGRDAILHVSWSAGMADSADLLLATSADLGAHFQAPVRVNLRPGEVVLRAGAGSADIVMTGDGTIIAHWMARGVEETGTQDFVVARSDDGGASFTAARADDGPDSTGRWAPSLCADARGSVWAAWVDARPRARDAARRSGEPPANDAAPRRVRLARSLDGGRSFLPSVDVMGDLDAAAAADSRTSLIARGGDLFVFFVRDTVGVVQVCGSRSRDGGATFETPAPLGAIDPASASGPVSALLPDGRWAVAWISSEGGGRGLRLVTGTWVDSTFAAPLSIAPAGEGVQTHPAIVVGGGLVVFSWREAAAPAAIPAFAVSRDGGATFGPSRRVGATPAEMSSDPVRCAVAGARHLFFVWPSAQAGLSFARALLPEESIIPLH